MTERQFLVAVELLHEDKCTCGESSLMVTYHNSKCGFRVPAWMLGKQYPDFQYITGGLYDAVTEALAA